MTARSPAARKTAVMALVLCAAASLSGCRDPVPAALPPVGAALIDQQRAACVADGGRFGAGGLKGTLVCYRNTPDGGKQCTRQSNCEGLCLARSGSCAPVTPVFGCNEILTETGERVNLCLD